MTKKKLAILEALTAKGDYEFHEYGPPPYAAVDVARDIQDDLSNTVKTLKLLERDGLVVREVATREVWNAIVHGGVDRKVVCYWNVATMARDKEAAEAWRAGADARSKAALASMFTIQAGGRQALALVERVDHCSTNPMTTKQLDIPRRTGRVPPRSA